MFSIPFVTCCSSFAEAAQNLADDTPYFIALVENAQTHELCGSLETMRRNRVSEAFRADVKARWTDMVLPHHTPHYIHLMDGIEHLDETRGALKWHVDCATGALLTTTPTTEFVLGPMRPRLPQYEPGEYDPRPGESVFSVMPGCAIVSVAKPDPVTGVNVSMRHRGPRGARAIIWSVNVPLIV